MPSKGSGEFTRGYIIPVGGCQNTFSPEVAEKIRSLCVTAEAKALILEVSDKSIDCDLTELLTENGFDACQKLTINTRQQANNPEIVAQLVGVDVIIITGERPVQISTIIGGTPVAKQLRKLNADGIHIAGTFGGAALVSEHMIVGGQESHVPKQGGVNMAPGLGLTNRYMIDYHFRQQGRLGRLLTALSYNPFTVGIGIDEQTALFISPEDELEVFGEGAAIIIDPSNLQYSSMGSAGSGDPISLFGLQMHILAKGARYSAGKKHDFDEHWA